MSEWISVKDRLPEPERRVLLLRTIGRITRMMVGYFHSENFYYDIDDLWNSPMIYETITHWQPLPEPPKADDP